LGAVKQLEISAAAKLFYVKPRPKNIIS